MNKSNDILKEQDNKIKYKWYLIVDLALIRDAKVPTSIQKYLHYGHKLKSSLADIFFVLEIGPNDGRKYINGIIESLQRQVIRIFFFA